MLPTGPDAIQPIGFASDSLEIELRLRKRLSRRHIHDSVGVPEISSREGKVRSIFDPCCGTGGMLTIGKEYVHQNINNKVRLRLLGQELN
ncbi:unnamed protein product, partial [marine sediment metagenome]